MRERRLSAKPVNELDRLMSSGHIVGWRLDPASPTREGLAGATADAPRTVILAQGGRCMTCRSAILPGDRALVFDRRGKRAGGGHVHVGCAPKQAGRPSSKASPRSPRPAAVPPQPLIAAPSKAPGTTSAPKGDKQSRGGPNRYGETVRTIAAARTSQPAGSGKPRPHAVGRERVAPADGTCPVCERRYNERQSVVLVRYLVARTVTVLCLAHARCAVLPDRHGLGLPNPRSRAKESP